MFQGGGNIPLIMPIVAELVARGHDVRVLAGPGIRPSRLPISQRFLDRIAAAGARYLPFAEPSPHPFDSAAPRRGLVFGWTPRRLVRMVDTEIRTTAWSPAWTVNVTHELRASQADVLVADFFLLGAIAAGEAARVPTAVLVHNAFPPHAPDQPPKYFGFALPSTPAQQARQRFWRWARETAYVRNGLEPLNHARSTLGLPPLRSPFQQYDAAARVLVLGSAAFDFPSRRLPPNVRYVGTPIDDSHAPEWISPWAADDNRPVVLVSLSTLNQGQAPALQRVLDALEGMSVRALVTVGPSLDVAAFRAPPNTVLETFVQHSAVLPHVAAMVTQCGLGGLTKALLHGVPLVCIPITGDQPDNAARIERHGAGVRLHPGATPTQIRSAINHVLTEPRFRQAAQSLATRLAGEPAERVAALELEFLAG